MRDGARVAASQSQVRGDHGPRGRDCVCSYLDDGLALRVLVLARVHLAELRDVVSERVPAHTRRERGTSAACGRQADE